MAILNDVLVERVLNAVPAASYEMGALLSVLRIEPTTDVPTAAVSCERRPVLRINPEFVETWCRTDEHLFLLVMHELHHVLLGHTRLFPRPTPAHNVAFDAVINALLCHRFPQRAYTSFFSNFYETAEGPYRLLAPPDGRPWPEGDPLGALHEMLYRKQTVTAAELFAAIVQRLPETPVNPALLGNHVDGVEGGLIGREEEIAAILESVVRKWPDCGDLHAGGGGDLARTQIDARTPAEKVLAVVRRALLSAATGWRGPRRLQYGHLHARAALPNVRDRRATVARAAGCAPLLFDSLLPACSRRPEGRAAVYVDVSGSMTAYLPALYGALRRLRAYVEPRVHLFSTVVHTTSLDELCNGARYSTLGTDINCVLAHALEQPTARALIVTDGFVGNPRAALRREFGRRPVDFRVLLTPVSMREQLSGIATRFDVLPPLDCGVRS